MLFYIDFMDYALGILGEKKLSRRRRGRTNRYSCQVESFNILEVFFLTFRATYSIKNTSDKVTKGNFQNKIKEISRIMIICTFYFQTPCTCLQRCGWPFWLVYATFQLQSDIRRVTGVTLWNENHLKMKRSAN